MIRNISICLMSFASCVVLNAEIIDTNDAAAVSAFRAGATGVDFESVAGVTPQAINSYHSGDAISPSAFLFDQVSGVQFSVGGMPGTNSPALFQLTGAIAGDAKSPTTVLGPVDFSFLTNFQGGAMMEIFFPEKVSKVGFWLNPSLGDVKLIAADTNFAFSHLPETNLETLDRAHAGNFVGIERSTADIGGFKIIGLGQAGFTIDNFTYAGDPGASAVPEPATSLLMGSVLASIGLLRRLRRQRSN